MEAHLEGLVAAEQHLTIQIIIMQVVEEAGILAAAVAQQLEAERAAAVRDAVAALPAELREALVFFEYEELAQAEIAATLGCTVKAVESRIARAREKLRRALRAWL